MITSKKSLTTLLATVWACHAFSGQQITVKNTSANPQSKSGQETTVVKMVSDSGKARIDFTEGQAPGADKGSYLLTQDSGKSFIMVLPKDKTYMKWDMDSMMNMAGAMGNMMQMKITDPKINTILDEAGPAVLGYPTRHYKIQTSYRISMSIMGFKNESNLSKEEEIWATTQLDLSVFDSWVRKTPKTKNESLDQLIAAEKNKIKGFPLKMLSTETTTDGQGKATVTRSSMEVTEIKSISAGAISFDIPADYQEMSLPMRAGIEEEQPKSESAPAKKAKSKFDFGSLMKQALDQVQ